MAFDAGSVVGHFGLDTQGYEDGANRVIKSNENITGSVLKANVIYDLAKKAVTELVNVVKDSVNAFKDQEKAEAQLTAVLKSTAGAAGVTRQEVLAMADAFQKTTTFGDEVILSGQNILLTFTKIGKDIFPLATETMLDMSQALGQDLKSSALQLGKALQDPITGITALRRVGVNFTDEQESMIKTLVESGRALEAQKLILAELQTEFGGSAKAARDTFGGALFALNNTIDETKETFGRYIAEAGKPFLDSINGVVQGINNFLSSREGLAQIQSVLVPIVGAFAVLWEIGKKLFDYLKQFAVGAINDTKDALSGIGGKGNEATTAFNALGGVVQIVGIGFSILSGTVKIAMDTIANLIKFIEGAANVLIGFGEALADIRNPQKWEHLGSLTKEFGTNFVTIFKDMATNTINTWDEVIDKFKTFGKDSIETGKELSTAYTVATGKITIAFGNLETQLFGTNDAIVKDTEYATNDIEKYWHDVAEAGAAVTSTAISAMILKISQTIKNAVTTARIGFNAIAGAAMGAASAGAKWWAEQWEKTFKDVMGYATSFVNQISGLFDLYYQGQMTNIDNWYKKEKESIESSTVDEETKQEQLSALEDEYNAKKAEQQKKAFIANQVMQIGNAIMNGAQAVMSIWATFAWNPVIAGILTGIVAGITAAEVALIAAQPIPEFALGGIAPANRPIIVGERGPELITLGQESRIYPNDELGMYYGEGKGIQQYNYYGDITSDVDMDVASMKQANRLKAALRA